MLKKNKMSAFGLLALAGSLALTGGGVLPSFVAAAEESTFSYTAYADTYEPKTGIVSPPSVVFDVDSSYDLSALSSEKSPAVALFHADAEGNVTDENGVAIGTLDEAVRFCNSRVIPGFYFETSSQMNAVLSYVTGKNLLDAMVFSDNALLVKQFKAARGNIQGGVFFRNADLSDHEEIVAIRDAVNIANAMIAVTQGNITKEGVEEIQSLGLTCWTVVTDTEYGIYEALYTGTNGMLCDSFSLAIDVMESITEPTMIRKVFLSGHRGEGSYPENTIVGAKAAYYYGADYIELDLMRTSDNELVIMHDATLNRTCNYTGEQTIANMTLEEIRQYKVGNLYEIPILEDFLDFAAERPDIKLLIELKTDDAKVVPLLVKKLEQYDIDDQIIVISAFTARLSDFKAAKPNISTNNLNSYTTIESLCYYAYTLNSSFGPGISYLNSTNVMVQARVRGIPVYSWTFSTVAKFEEYMYLNTSLTSDYSSIVKDQVIALNANTEKVYNVQQSACVTVEGVATHRQRLKVVASDRETQTAELWLTAGAAIFPTARKLADIASYSDSKLTLGFQTGYGIYYFTTKWQSVSTEHYYYIMSRPFEVISGIDESIYREELTEEKYLSLLVQEPSSDDKLNDELEGNNNGAKPDQNGESDNNGETKASGCGSIIFGGLGGGIAFGIISITLALVLVCRKRNV